MRSDKQNKRGGFTLVELMVVIVILGLLVSIVGTNVLGQSETAKLETSKMQVGKFYVVPSAGAAGPHPPAQW